MELSAGEKRERQKMRFVERGAINVPFEKRRNKVAEIFRGLKEDGWGAVWDDRTLRHVASSEQTYLAHFNRGTDVKNAEILETLTNWGITELGWLGNFAHTDDEGKVTKPFLAYAESAREFDDKRHRVDTVVTLQVGEDVTREFPTIEGGRIVMGLDVTTWECNTGVTKGVAEVEELEYFADKISRTNNETNEFQEVVPFGFTQVDFYLDPWKFDEAGRRVRRGLRWVPRFVIGIRGREAEEIQKRDFCYKGKAQGYVPKAAEVLQGDWRTAVAGFKVMSEIRAQAEMLMQMMPEDFKKSAECMAAREQLAVIRDKMRRGLKRSVERTGSLLAEAGLLPAGLARQIQGASAEQAVNMLERALAGERFWRDDGAVDIGESVCDAEGDLVDASREVYSDDWELAKICDRTYGGIMRAVRSFKECAASPRSAAVRKLQPRNIGVKWTGRVREIKYE